MSLHGDDGRHLVKAIREANEGVAEARAMTVESVLDEYEENPRALALAVLVLRQDVADLKRAAAYDYWPGA